MGRASGENKRLLLASMMRRHFTSGLMKNIASGGSSLGAGGLLGRGWQPFLVMKMQKPLIAAMESGG
jgi:hypothetical protein